MESALYFGGFIAVDRVVLFLTDNKCDETS